MQVALKSSLKRCEAKDPKNVEVGSLLAHESNDVFPTTHAFVLDVLEISEPCAPALAATLMMNITVKILIVINC